MCHGLGRANRPGLTRAIRQEHDSHSRVNEWIEHTTLDPQEVWNGAGLRDPRSQMCNMKGEKELNCDEAEASPQAFNGEQQSTRGADLRAQNNECIGVKGKQHTKKHSNGECKSHPRCCLREARGAGGSSHPNSSLL